MHPHLDANVIVRCMCSFFVSVTFSFYKSCLIMQRPVLLHTFEVSSWRLRYFFRSFRNSSYYREKKIFLLKITILIYFSRQHIINRFLPEKHTSRNYRRRYEHQWNRMKLSVVSQSRNWRKIEGHKFFCVGTESEKLRNYTNVLHLKRGNYKHVYTLEIICQ